jgi:hypothetical protein
MPCESEVGVGRASMKDKILFVEKIWEKDAIAAQATQAKITMITLLKVGFTSKNPFKSQSTNVPNIAAAIIPKKIIMNCIKSPKANDFLVVL